MITRKQIRNIFKGHYSCAFRNDVNLNALDCLTNMEDAILVLNKKKDLKKLKQERIRVYREILKTGRLNEVELFIVEGNLEKALKKELASHQEK